MEIVGRLTANAVVRTVKKNEAKVVSFSIAVNDRYRKKDGEVKNFTTYFNCDYWVNPGIADYLTKGTLVELYGRVSVNTWTNAEGEAKAGLNFHVNSIKLHGSRSPQNEQAEHATVEVAKNNDDLPF